MDNIIFALKNSNKVLVTSHVAPDGDAIGSMIAIGETLNYLKKQVVLYNESPILPVYKFIKSSSLIIQEIKDINIFDTLIILDCSDINRIGKISHKIKNSNNFKQIIINIDHHVTNTNFGDLKLIDSQACATTEIVYNLIKKMQTPINRDIASAIYTGIFTDTGSFRFSNTNKAAFAICNEMIELGTEPYTVAKNVYGTYSLGRIKLLNLALDSIEILNDGNVCVISITKSMMDETKTYEEDVEDFINYVRRIENIKVAILIHEKPEECYVSLRSDGSVDVSNIALSFGGGGHFVCAGFKSNLQFLDLKIKVLAKISDILSKENN